MCPGLESFIIMTHIIMRFTLNICDSFIIIAIYWEDAQHVIDLLSLDVIWLQLVLKFKSKCKQNNDKDFGIFDY